MGGIIAKIDNDNIVSIESQNPTISKQVLDKLKDYYNKYGIIKIQIDENKLDSISICSIDSDNYSYNEIEIIEFK